MGCVAEGVPGKRVAMVRAADPAAETGCGVPIGMPASKKETDPVSSPPTFVAPETLAVSVIDAPALAGLVPVTVVVVAMGVTINVVGAEELIASFGSPGSPE